MRNKIAKSIKRFTESRTVGEPKGYTTRIYRQLKKQYLNASGRDKANIREMLKQKT